MWCVLENKAPCWDNLQKRSFQGLGWCILCKNATESVQRLFFTCPYIIAVWKECSKIYGLPCRWEGINILQTWENWRISNAEDSMKALPLIVIWGVWLAQNQLIFDEK